MDHDDIAKLEQAERRREFAEAAQARWERYLATGKSVPAADGIARLEARLAEARRDIALRKRSNGRARLSETVDALGANDRGVVLQMIPDGSLAVPVLDERTAKRQAMAALPLLQKAVKPQD